MRTKQKCDVVRHKLKNEMMFICKTTTSWEVARKVASNNSDQSERMHTEFYSTLLYSSTSTRVEMVLPTELLLLSSVVFEGSNSSNYYTCFTNRVFTRCELYDVYFVFLHL